MVNAGASIEAFLRLDATNFKEGITSSKASVEEFKKAVDLVNSSITKDTNTTLSAVNKLVESITEMGVEGNNLVNGFNHISQSLHNLVNIMNEFDTVETSSVNKFKTMALGMENLATAAQRLSVVMQRGGTGIEALTTIMQVFETGMASAEVQLKLTASQIDVLKSKMDLTNSSTKQVSNTYQQTNQSLALYHQELRGLITDVETFNSFEGTTATTTQRLSNVTKLVGKDLGLFHTELKGLIADVETFNSFEGTTATTTQRLASVTELVGKDLGMFHTELKGLISDVATFNGLESKTVSETERLAVAEEKARVEAERMALADKEVVAMQNQVSTTMNKVNASVNSSTASMERMTSASQRLGKGLSSLRMIGTMVASMFVWNFAHSLVTSTRETVNAKSEMEGYFQMLHFGQNQIKDFNDELDETIKKFPRINKYSLGETISSIGVEFNLTTKEMKKAMPVVSMITSEYLRAGRNANEASLAVKDILQGEFQRLSRETGVKGDQLKEAGWSGDKKDVMGLLEALDTVGKSRNWDIFVTKANSLNDAVMILKNRFGEWTAEMVNVVQPSILRVFNDLMTVGGAFGQVFGKVWEWLNGDGLVESSVRWGAIATAITGVIGALISYRTGANLTQIVQMGLRGTIIATTLGLKAEEVATYGSRNAIVSRITSIKAQTVAEMGVKNAILSKIVGLNAELIAHNGVKGAIMSEVFAREMEEARLNGFTTAMKTNLYLEQQERLSKMSTTKAIIAHTLGLDKELFAKKGLIVAMAERIAQSPLYIGSLKAEEVAELSTAEAALLLTGTLLPLVAIFVGLAVAIYGVVKPLQDASAEMKAFNNLVDKGDDIIKEHKSTYDSLKDSYDAQNSKLSELTESTKKYLRQQDKVKMLEKDRDQAEKNWKNSIKAVEMARSRQAKFEDERDKIRIHSQTTLSDAYIKAGLSAREASELSSHELNEAKKGAEQLRSALQMLKFEAEKGDKKTTKTIDMLKKYGLDKDSIKKYGTNLSEAQYKISEGLEKFMTSDDLMDRFMGWLEIQQGRLEEWWTEMNAFFEVRDWKSMGDKLVEGFKYVLDWTPIGQALEEFANDMQDKGVVGTLTEALFGEGDSDGAWDVFAQWGNECIVQPLKSWLDWFMEDPSAHLGQMREEWSVALAKLLFGKNSDGKALYDITQEWIDNEVMPSIQDAISDYFSVDNIMSGGFTFGGVGALTHDLPKLLFGDDASIKSVIEGKTVELTGWFGEAVYNGIKSIPFFGAIIELFETLTDENTGASLKGMQVGEWFGNGLNEMVNHIPILGQVKQMLELLGQSSDEAKSKVDQNTSDIASSVTSTSTNTTNSLTTMKNSHKTIMDSMVSHNKQSFDDMKNKNNTSLLAMRDSTTQTTQQMTSAWDVMRISIVDSARKIRSDSTSNFNSLGTVIGTFYRNIQSPMNWANASASAVATKFSGSGYRSWSRTPRPHSVRRVMGKHGAGLNPYTSPNKKMSLKDLMDMVGSDKEVNLSDFLSMFVDSGFGAWNFAPPHNRYIKNTADLWMTAPAYIQGIGSVGNGYQVGRFQGGTPHFTFDEFLATAESIFSVIPYKFYMDSDWKGNWVNALMSGATNCSDGTDALLALAHLFGFSGEKVHTTLKNGTGHFYAMINGRALDTTNFQHRGSWSPLGGAGIPPRSHSVGNNTTHNITIDMSNSNFYGEDDFKEQLRQASREVLREEFNDPFTIAL